MKSLPHPSRAGSASSVIGRIFFAAVLLWIGGEDLYTWFRNKQITSITLTEYLKKKPEAEWLEIKGATLDIPGAAMRKGLGDEITELYIPLITNRGEEGPARVVLHTKDLGFRVLYKELSVLPEEKVIEFVLKNSARLWPKHDVRVLVDFGISSKKKEREKLSALKLNLAPDFVLVKEGEEPKLGFGGFAVGGGLLLLGSTLFGRKGGPSRSAPPSFPQR